MKTTLIYSLLFFTSFNIFSQSASNEKLFKDRTETEKWLTENHIPVLGIGYIKDGKIKEISVYGNLEKGISAPENTIFNVASLTKPITAMVALKLVNEGKWNLDEPLYKYWTDPDIATDPRTKKITTRHVLSHQTGFPNWRNKNTNGKLAFESEPGAAYKYSGEGYEYLRKALENKFQKTLDQLAKELIFQPLQMNETRFIWDDAMDEKRFAKGYDAKGNQYKTGKRKTANAADDLLTTVQDYTTFILHVMNGAGLTDEWYSQMISNQVKIKSNQYCGLGWMVDEPIGDEEFAMTHGGKDEGVNTIVFILPKSKEGLVIFTTVDNGTSTYIPTIVAYLGSRGQEIINIETK